jgi:hypothetical protein
MSSTIPPLIKIHLKQTTVVVGVRVNLKNGYHCSNKYYLKHIVRVLLDCGHNRHLVIVTKDKPMLFPHSNGLVSQSWNTSNGISQKHWAKGELNFLHYSDSKRSYSEPDVVKYDQTLIAKGSIQNLMCLSMTDSNSKRFYSEPDAFEYNRL